MFVEPGNNSVRVALLNPVNIRRAQSIAFESLEEVEKQAEWKGMLTERFSVRILVQRMNGFELRFFARLNKCYGEVWRY